MSRKGESNMKLIYELLQESVILQGFLTIGVWSAVIYMVIVGQDVPEILQSAASLTLGFYFGSKLALRKSQYPNSH